MSEIAMTEGIKPRKAPKTLNHLEIHPKLGGGHIVKHVYSNYQHEPKEHHFGPDDGERAMKHIAKHAGLPHPEIEEQGDSEPEPHWEHDE